MYTGVKGLQEAASVKVEGYVLEVCVFDHKGVVAFYDPCIAAGYVDLLGSRLEAVWIRFFEAVVGDEAVLAGGQCEGKPAFAVCLDGLYGALTKGVAGTFAYVEFEVGQWHGGTVLLKHFFAGGCSAAIGFGVHHLAGDLVGFAFRLFGIVIWPTTPFILARAGTVSFVHSRV